MLRLTKNKIRTIVLIFVAVLLFSPLIGNKAYASGEFLYLGGIPAGFTIKTNGSTVIGLNDVITEKGVESPARANDVRVGDVILSVGGKPVSNVQSIAESIKNCCGNPVEVVISRKGQKIVKYITPAKDVGGNYRLGLFLRDDLNGIGTITYFRNSGEFAALGHPVLDESGEKSDVFGGDCYLCSIIGIVKGKRGKAGELKGIFIDTDKIGTVTKNTDTGLYGKSAENFSFNKFTKVEVGVGVAGNASIITCIDGVSPKEYSISIVKADFNDKDNKNFVIKITDRELLSATNGILQGMSGSPIVQKGKIVGAVTHVFINDPSRGFGIDVAKMLEN